MTINGDVSQDCTTAAIAADQLVLRRNINSVQTESKGGTVAALPWSGHGGRVQVVLH